VFENHALWNAGFTDNMVRTTYFVFT